MPESCQAAVFHGTDQSITIENVPVPPLGEGESLVRVTCCTVCGSDLHTFGGKRSTPLPTILGHEIVGKVDSITDGLTDVDKQPLEIGDRVTWSIAASCGDCANCNRGIPQKCSTLFKYGHEQLTDQSGPHGGLAEYCLLRRGTAIVKLPQNLSDEAICPANCATATVACAIRSAGELGQRRVLILGAGMLGLTASAMSATAGAAEVCVCDPNESRLRRAEEFGATRLAPIEAPQTEFDVIFEMSGSNEAIESALEVAAVGATIVLVGSVFPSSDVPVNPEQVVRRLLTIRGVHNYAPEDLRNGVNFLTQNHSRFPFEELVSRHFDLADADEALQYAIKNRPIRVAIKP